jgi:hypothetical protein
MPGRELEENASESVKKNSIGRVSGCRRKVGFVESAKVQDGWQWKGGKAAER